MAVNPMMSAGINGIQAGVRGHRQAAQDIAELNIGAEMDRGDRNAPVEDWVGDAAEAVVDLKLYERQVQASAKVVQTADAVIGMLLDTDA